MTNEQMRIGKKVYFWGFGSRWDEVPTLRSGRVVGGWVEHSTIYGYVYQIESNGEEFRRRAWNCYESVEDAQQALVELVIEGAEE